MDPSTLRTNAEAEAAYEARDFARASPLFKSVIAQCEASGVRGLDYAHALLSLASCYRYRCVADTPAGLPYCERAMAALSKLDASDINVAGCRAQVEHMAGYSYAYTGRVTEALHAFKSALPFFLRVDDSERAADLMVNIAQQLITTGEATLGLRYLDGADQAMKGARTARSTALQAVSTLCRGNSLQALGRHAEALAYLTKHLQAESRRHGGDSAAAALVMTAIGRAHRDLGDRKRALSTFQAAYSVLSRREREHLPEYASVLLNLGTLHMELGGFEVALGYLERSLAINSTMLHPSHPYIATTLHNIASAKGLLGRGDAAATRAAAVAAGRRSQTACAGLGCGRKLREDGEPLDVCVRCRCTFYCGKACQTADWKREGGHKAECKALIAAAAAAEREGSL